MCFIYWWLSAQMVLLTPSHPMPKRWNEHKEYMRLKRYFHILMTGLTGPVKIYLYMKKKKNHQRFHVSILGIGDCIMYLCYIRKKSHFFFDFFFTNGSFFFNWYLFHILKMAFFNVLFMVQMFQQFLYGKSLLY